MLNTAQKFEKTFNSYDDLDPHFRIELSLGDGPRVFDHTDWADIMRFFFCSLRSFMNLQKKKCQELLR